MTTYTNCYKVMIFYIQSVIKQYDNYRGDYTFRRRYDYITVKCFSYAIMNNKSFFVEYSDTIIKQ